MKVTDGERIADVPAGTEFPCPKCGEPCLKVESTWNCSTCGRGWTRAAVKQVLIQFELDTEDYDSEDMTKEQVRVLVSEMLKGESDWPWDDGPPAARIDIV